ncbi:hypothetical protein D3C73_15000 [compost metagenome]
MGPFSLEVDICASYHRRIEAIVLYSTHQAKFEEARMSEDRSSKKLRKLLIIAVMVVVVGAGGVLIWQLLPKKNTETVAQQTEVKSYSKTTTVPADWKKYTDARYPFSISYPPQWTPMADTKLNPVLYDYEVDFMDANDKSHANAIVGVKKQSLQDAVAQFKSGFLEVGEVRPKLLSETKLKIDGNEAVEIRYQQDIGTATNHRLGDIEKQYFISHDGNVYTPQPVYESGQPGGLNAGQSLVFFESLTIKKK